MSSKPPHRPRLGRGLSSLIPTGDSDDDTSSRTYFLCPIDQIEAFANQPRKHFDAAALEDLAESISQSGILQPLVVRKVQNGYRLIAGERRFRAAKLANLHEVPVVVREVSDSDAFTLALIENIQREDLNPIEEAEAYRHLNEDYGFTHEDIARRVGRARASVSNTLRLLALPDQARDLVRQGALSAGHARAILSAAEAHRAWVTEEIAERELTVRAAEALARQTHKEGFEPAQGKTPTQRALFDDDLYTPNVRAAERRLREHIGHQVKIRRKSDRTGVIELHFSDDDALNGILASILDE